MKGGARRPRRHRGVKVLKLADGRRVARWLDPLSGKQQQQSLDALGLTTDGARREWARQKSVSLATLRAAVASGAAVAEKVTPDEALDTYFGRFGNKLTRASKEAPLNAFVAFIREQGVRHLQDVSPPVLARWRDDVLKPGKDGKMLSTRARWIAAASIFLNWAVERGWLPRLTRDAIRFGLKKPVVPRDEIAFLRPAALRKLFEAVLRHDEAEPQDRRVGAFVLTLLGTGMRFREAADLAWSEVDLAANEIRLPAARCKTKQARAIDLAPSPTVAALLRGLALKRGDQVRVFGIEKHREWQDAQARLIESYGAPEGLTAHALRRSAGSLMTCAPSIFGAASAFLSARRLGHSVTIAERSYAGTLTNLPRDARTIEDAAGIRDLCDRVVHANGGTVERDAGAAAG